MMTECRSLYGREYESNGKEPRGLFRVMVLFFIVIVIIQKNILSCILKISVFYLYIN